MLNEKIDSSFVTNILVHYKTKKSLEEYILHVNTFIIYCSILLKV